MKWYVATATIPISVSVEFDIEENSSQEEINKLAKKLIDIEINEILGGIDFMDEDVSPINIESID